MDFSQIDTYSQEELEDLLDEVNDNYYNGKKGQKNMMTDDEFDFMKEFLISKYPKTHYRNKTGHEVSSGKKVELPKWMGSMTNIKEEKKINRWIDKYSNDDGELEVVEMSKLDGISALLNKDGCGIKLYTRGNGKSGKDISQLIPYLKIPDLSSHSEICIRGELLVKMDIYEKLNSDSANSRSFVSGLVNSKKPDPINVKYIDFVAYEMLYPEFKISEQLKKIKKLGFKTVQNKMVTGINFKHLQEELKLFKETSPYLIDGIIIRHNKNYSYNKSGNPDYAFAFKMLLNEQVAETTVVEVEWNVSKYRKLYPRVKIKKVQIGGVNIEYVSGKSARFIQDNKIGVGTIIQIARSCDVIPDIVKIVKKAKQADMPNTEYEWNETNVDIFSIDEGDDQKCQIKLITDFFKNINVEGLGPGIVKKIYENGFTEIKEILHITANDLLDMEGFQDRSAKKLVSNIKNAVNSVNLIELMNASNIFGRGLGKRRLEALFSNIPDLMERQSNNSLKEDIMEVEGFSNITAKQFVDNFNDFKKFMKKLNIKAPNLKEYVSKVKIKKNIVFTGFRNNELEKVLEENGFAVNSSINAETVLVIKKDSSNHSSKIKEAEKKKLKVITLDTFLKNKEKFISK